MHRTLSTILFFAWALWLGGMIALMIFVIRLFDLSRTIAIEAAPVLFGVFAVYQLVVGLIAATAGTSLTLATKRSVHAAMSLLMILALAAALLINDWTGEMESLRLAGQSSGPRFALLHRWSSWAYVTSACLLVAAGTGWCLTLCSPGKARKTAGG